MDDNPGPPTAAIPDDLRVHYKRLEGKPELRVAVHNIRDYSYDHGNVPAKRGFELKFCPVLDLRTGHLHPGKPENTELSMKTKKELHGVLGMCARAQPPVMPQGISAVLIDSARTVANEPRLECETCQGKHNERECMYPCHRCISAGPFHSPGHRCLPALCFSNISQDYKRGLVLYQAWPPSTHSVNRDVYVIDRRPRFRPLPEELMRILRRAIRDFNGSVLLVDVSTYDTWRRRLLASGDEGLEAPVRIKMPYRMLGFFNVEFTVDLLDNVYLPVVEARQGTRYACFGVTLSERRYFEAQRDPMGGYRIHNMQEIVEVVLTIQDYQPEEDEMHAELGELRAGARMFIFPHGVCDRKSDGSVHIPEHRYRQILKKAPFHPVGANGREDTSKLCLIWDGFQTPGDGTRSGLRQESADDDDFAAPGTSRDMTFRGGFDFSQTTRRRVKRARDGFVRHLSLMRLTDVEIDELLQVFDRATDFEENRAEKAFANTLFRLRIGVNAFMDMAYSPAREDPLTGQKYYSKRSSAAFDDLLDGLVRSTPDISPEVRHSLRRLYEALPRNSVLEAGFLEMVEILKRTRFSVDDFFQLAYYDETVPQVYDLDFAHDEGLYDLRRTREVFGDYMQHIENHPVGHMGVKEIFGPPGRSCLRVVAECFTGGPAIEQRHRDAFVHKLNGLPDPDKTLWPINQSTNDGFKLFFCTVLGERVELDEDQWRAIHAMIVNVLFVLIGMSGSGKTQLTCAAMLYAMFMYGERILILTETNAGAVDMYNTLVGMLASLEERLPDALSEARSRVRGDFRWVSHSLTKEATIDETDAAVARVCQTKGRSLITNSRIVVSTLGHARSKAIQCFRADTIVIDESARSTLLSVLTTLIERWLNTSAQTTKIMPDRTPEGYMVTVCNPHPAKRLILVGDPNQGLPQMLSQPITDKRTAWALGENLNAMTCFMQCGADFVRLSRSFRSSHYGIQPLFQRFYNHRIGRYADAMNEVVAVKDASDAFRELHRLPLVVGAHLECPSLRKVIRLEGAKGRYAWLESTPDDDANLRFRHVIIRSSAPGNESLSRRNKLKSQVNPWHVFLILETLEALFDDGVFVRVHPDSGVRELEPVVGKHILICTPYRGQMHALNRAMRTRFPMRKDLPDVRVMTTKSVQGLQAPIVFTDFVKSTPTDFLLGHHTHDYQCHHNEYYSVGLSRYQTTQFTIATLWKIDESSVTFHRPGGKKEIVKVEKSYLDWAVTSRAKGGSLNQRFYRPGDLIPVERGLPVVDPMSDNLWLFFVFSEKYYDVDRRRWHFHDAYHWQRGVGTIHAPCPEYFNEIN